MEQRSWGSAGSGRGRGSDCGPAGMIVIGSKLGQSGRRREAGAL